MKKLPRDFYVTDTVAVARALLGKLLVHRVQGKRLVGRITEVEAYVGAHDKAAHTARGITPRTAVMFGEPGHAYVYLIYGIHHCVNVVTEPAGHGSAVLLRAVEPIEGISADTRGPGLLCRAMHIDMSCNRADLCGNSLFIEDDGYQPGNVLATPRVGVDYAGEWAAAPLRFVEEGNPWVSRAKGGRKALPEIKPGQEANL